MMNSISLPQLFIDRLRAIIPPIKFSSCLACFHEPSYTAFRINTLLAESVETINKLQEEGFTITTTPFIKDAYVIPAAQKAQLTTSALFLSGKIYIQNLASMLPVLILNPQPHEHILDLAAAPGSKTSQIAMLMNNSGKIAAVEPVKERFFKLKANLNLLGVTNTKCYLKNGISIWRYCTNQFDRVLLDAPCSSEARFNLYDSNSFAYWSEKKLIEMSRKQKQLLFSAIRCVKLGGVVVYATCSFAPEENEEVIQRLLDKYGDAISVEPINMFGLENTQPGLLSWGKQRFSECMSHTIRILPNEWMHGFFICKIKKLRDI